MASAKELKSIHKKILKKIISFFGYEIKRKNSFLDKFSDYIAEATKEEFDDLIFFESNSLASRLNLWSINRSLKYISENRIEGDIVECGVYQGYTLAYIAKLLEKLNLKKKIIGFDTFEDGFIDDTFTEFDTDFKKQKKLNHKDVNSSAPYFTKDQVISNIHNITTFKDYDLIKGNVIETLDLQRNLPDKICFLRLDTDLYKTTKKQLEVLYPKLVAGGVLHIDDYGFFSGAKKAVDEFFCNKKIWLHRADLTCRYMIKG